MKATTRKYHEALVKLGAALGFVSETEVSASALYRGGDAGYRPRVDLLWSLPLDLPMRTALAWALERDVESVTHLPVVGIEVEGTTPSTKIMTSDIANLAALGALVGLLVVSEAGEKGIYARATRAIRSLRRSFGDLTVVPLDTSWLEALAAQDWPAGDAPVSAPKRGKPTGGETLDWSARTRASLRERGEKAGFVVVESYKPQVLGITYDWQVQRSKAPLRHTTNPAEKKHAAMSSARDYLTESQLDLVWLMPLPQSLGAFLKAIDGFDPCHRDHGLHFHEAWSHCALVAFELDSTTGKHAGGGLLNLAAYSVRGVMATETEAASAEHARTLKTYQSTLGLKNVTVRHLP